MDDLYENLVRYALPLLAASLAGGLIGLEREYRGRPAGLRTHILVALASSTLMIAAVHQFTWMDDTPHEVIRIDPVRMAHGILTGIGFLCGGVIFRQGLTVHGLTTAASLWVTSALGTLYGMSLYGLAIGGTLITLVVLAGFRWADHHVPQLSVIDVVVRYRRRDALPEPEFRALLDELSLHSSAITHRLLQGGELIELASTVRGKGAEKGQELAARLCKDDRVFEFEVAPRKD
ncbi:MgtC/SapB family protein [Phenylobacterium deserti]|uniref:Protein MgtC n=1 Tax=Phenylobacterium deserti TaxID=1914756 RepID=A0A328AVI6_9CAUL|nr:MgtC/SapB family protein [Phenylobacterium deserti]RAK56938.1 MgtC/SapB family protein [Phenylobacterium deserti]